ncbi:hypothetical protein [Saccharothrix syringae]|uniref:Uncharacterized protein n=1 Tax=Saccharothrix syringae TaxID=103733 RepID=A0A5Q0H5M7_SACSY|nr:hypothetical protein [Saccharothrix syringae]QFZ21254.1 hypothetical protein EKG83_31155 [Saccharothrix syringae]
MNQPSADVRETGSGRPPAVADVDRIAANPDPVVRNLQITHCYAELSRALAARTGGAANWCTFAVWASKQVGQTIRQEDLARALERLLAGSPEVAAGVDLVVRGLRRAVPGRAVADAEGLVRRVVVATARLDAVGDAAARGNRKVFEEIAREFARFLAEFPGREFPGSGSSSGSGSGSGSGDGVGEDRRVAEFCEALRPGEPPEGQRYLRYAFARYHRAMVTDDPKQRAELLLLANIEVGLHEQTRLQPEITAALEGPVVDPRELERRLLDLVLPDNRVLRWLRLALLTVLGRRTPVRLAGEQLADHVRALARRVVTEHLMTLALPGGEVLDLGEDLPARFPPLLAQLVNPELLALLATVDPTKDSLLDTAARDWSDLPDRMHYIADMFRCHAQRADLFDPPFTDEQVEQLTSGRRPSGRL